MNYPLISEYIEAIKASEDNFEELNHLRPVLDEEGEPVMTSGNFAVVFKMKDEQTGKLHAVKCFLKEQEGRAEAYRMIAEELEYVNSTFLTPIKYLDKELFVDSSNSEDSEFPVLLMDWVEGQTLDKYIREHIDDQYELSLLAYQFSRLAMWLMPQPFAHGDLKPDNILVKEDGTLVLVDYDGMYVPAMKGQKARELGSPDFRHPGRTEEVFDDHIDDFSLASILLSLKAISLQPSLLEEYGASDRLLFSEKDYRNLSESSALGALQPLMQDAELASLYSLYILALSQNNLSQVSFRLFNLKRPDKLQYEEENLSTEVTEEDLANAWMDEYGVKYSADRKRLLKAPIDIKKYTIRKGTKIICDNAFTNIIDVDYRDVKSHCEYPDFVEKVETWGGELEMVSIPRGITKIGEKAFYNCEKLATISVPDGVKLIDNAAFYGCSNLVFISMPDSVSYLGREIFGGCYSLSEIYLPINLKEIPVRAFAKCKSLKFAVIPHGIKKIGTHAFDGCTSLASIEIPNSVEEITIGAFNRCENLDSVVLHNGLKKIGQSAFESCESLSELTLPESLEEIGIGAFRWSGLTTIFIPKKVTKIREEAFGGCLKLTSIVVDKDNTFFDSRHNCNAIIETESNTLLTGCLNSTIPNSVLIIGRSAFYDIKGLSTISIPNGVQKIDKYAFNSCRDLSTITIPNSVKEIGDCVFGSCYSLSSIFVSNSAIKTGNDIFQLCNEKPFIHIPLGTRDKFEELFPRYKDKFVEQDDDEKCLAYCSVNSKACEDKEYALWQPHAKIMMKNGKVGVVIDDGITKKQIIPFAYDTWFDYDGYETEIREDFFDNYQDYIGYFAIKNVDGTLTIHGFDKEGTLTTSFKCEKFNPDSFKLNGKWFLRNPADGEEYDEIVRKAMHCETYLDTCFLAFRKGNLWSLKSDDLIITYIDEVECDGFGQMYWTPKGYYVEIKTGEKSQICLCKKNTKTLVIPEKYDYVSLRYFGKSNYGIDGTCFEIRRGNKLAVCSNDLQFMSPFIFDKVGAMINENEVKVVRKVDAKEYEFIYRIINSNGWRVKDSRPFGPEDIAAVYYADVVNSKYGLSVRFKMKKDGRFGGYKFIPLSTYSTLSAGCEFDMTNALLITLCREGDDDIFRVIE